MLEDTSVKVTSLAVFSSDELVAYGDSKGFVYILDNKSKKVV